MRRTLRCLLALAALGAGLGPARGVDVISPLVPQPPPVGPLFSPIDQAVSVAVEDRREDKHLMGGGVMGPSFESGSGLYLLYATETDAEIGAHVKAAAEDAVKVLGFRVGEGDVKLAIAIEEFWIDMYRMSSFGPMNCIAYATLQVTVTAPGLTAPAVVPLRLTYWEDTVPVNSMKEVAREAVSRIYSQAAWQAVAAALLDRRGAQADPEQVRRVLEQIGPPQKEVARARLAIFWLAITRRDEPAVKEKLLALLQQDEEQRLRLAAAEGLGLMRATEAAPELAALLGGKAPKVWDVTDAEQVWYLLHALALLGQEDLRSRLPAQAAKEMDARSKVEDLIAFHEGGKPPAMSDAAAAKLAKAKEKLAKKRSK